MDKIEKIYGQSRFEAILYYLKAQGIHTVSDLREFDFRELMFIPGVSTEIVEDAKKQYEKILDIKLNPIPADIVRGLKNYNAEQFSDKEEDDCDPYIPETEIVQVYADIPRSGPFIRWCHSRDKIFMHQLSYKDFKKIEKLKGMGPVSVQRYKKVYQEFLEPKTEEVTEKTEVDGQLNIENQFAGIDKEKNEHFISDVKIVDAYLGVARCAPLIRWCQSKDKVYMHQISYEDFETIKTLKGIGAVTAHGLEKIYEKFAGPLKGEFKEKKEKTVTLSADTPIEEVFIKLPQGKLFCDYCRSVDIFVLSDLKDFSFDHNEIQGIGVDSIERLQLAYVDAAKHYDPSPLSSSFFSYIPCINYGISIPESMSVEGLYCIGDICIKGLQVDQFIKIREWLKSYRISIVDIYTSKLLRLGEREQYCLLKRARGKTLQEIAEHIGVTRERVRQIVFKVTRKLMPTITSLTESMFYPNKMFFTSDDLLQVLSDPIQTEVYRSIIKSRANPYPAVYLDFADKFLQGSLDKQDYEAILHQLAEEEIGNGLNFYDNLERIDAKVVERIPALDFEDFMSFLINTGAHFYGDYVMRGRKTYGIVCADAVRKFFPHGIKLNSDEKNEDLLKLRKIITRHYGDFELPENNRALSSSMMRALILCGRSRYCHIDSVVYDMTLFNEIDEYMQSTPQPSFHYSELFELFKGRLLSETNITNYSFLHGMLKYLFLDDYDFNDRDIITKKGEVRQNSDARISELLLNSDVPLTTKEIQSAFPGVKDIIIAFSVNRVEEIIQWDYNTYNHINNLDVTENDMQNLASLIETGMKKYKGYLSENLLYDKVKISFPQFLDKNRIENEKNLYYTVSYLFSDSYRFRRPHLLSLDVEIDDLTLINVAKYFLDFKDGLNYNEFLNLASRLGWSRGTIYAALRDLEKEIIRISEDDYVLPDMFVFEDDFIRRFKESIASLVKDSGYYGLFAYLPFNKFPPCQFEWNSFLVESIILEHEIGFKILSPQTASRYQRGIIVNSSHSAHSLEEFVAHTMRVDGNIALTESEFGDYLKDKGIIYTNNVPQELYNCPEIAYKNEKFRLPE